MPEGRYTFVDTFCVMLVMLLLCFMLGWIKPSIVVVTNHATADTLTFESP